MSARRLTVFVRGLELQAGIGVHDHERGRLQRLVVDVELTLAADGPVEHLAETVNYETVAAAARAIVAAGHIGLVESFAERLAVSCLDEAVVTAVRVVVAKPGAVPGTEAVGCVLERTR